MNPSSMKAAGREARLLARKQFTRLANDTARRRISYVGLVAQKIWARWSVGVYRWKVKHVRWFLEHCVRENSPASRYQYWLSIRAMLKILGKEHWLALLQGDWVRPDSKSE